MIWLQGHPGKAWVPAIKCRVVNPSAQRFIVSQRPSYLQSEEARVGVHEPWCDAAVPPMSVDQDQFSLTHLPGLLHEFRQDSTPDNVPGVISVKINLHSGPITYTQRVQGSKGA